MHFVISRHVLSLRSAWTRARPQSRYSHWKTSLQPELRPFSSLRPRWSPHSVLSKYGLSVDWLEKRKLEMHDCDDTLFSKRLRFDKREIRLLWIIPNPDPASTVEMIMAHCDLENHPPYEALSYTGGNPYSSSSAKEQPNADAIDPWEEKTMIMVNCIEFPVKRNLMEALRRFRVTHANKAIWIDSICINEADPIERAEQVRLMGEVYGEAEDVPIWLGETIKGLETALSLVKSINSAFKRWYDSNYPVGFRESWDQIIRRTETTPDALDQADFWKWLQSEECRPFFENIDLRKHRVRTDKMAWHVLRDMLLLRWFDRVWTWQEKELAKHATIYIGERTLLWAELRFAMLLVMAHDLSETRATPSMMMRGREYEHVLDSLGVRSSPDLLDIVMNVRHRDTQLKRDKIFGVIGAAARYQDEPSDDVAHFSRLVNYGYLTSEDLYREFSRYWIMEKRDLRVLQACNPFHQKVEALPSWVVDWSDVTPSHQLSTRLYNASKGKDKVEVKYHYHLNPNELQISGISIDKVKIVYNDRGIDKSERQLNTRSMNSDHWRARLVQPLVSLYVASLGDKDKGLLPPCWDQAIEDMEWDKPYQPTGESMPNAFWRTLLSDQNPYITTATDQRIAPDKDIASLFDEWAYRRALTRSLIPKSKTDEWRHRDAVMRKDLKEAGRNPREAEVAAQRWHEALYPSVMYKRFFVTEKGLIGLAPKHIQAGDEVCIFFGGKVPFTVRQTEDHYTLVEETYLHGFMDGEAIKLLERGELSSAKFCIR